jgi:hypothetical protein
MEPSLRRVRGLIYVLTDVEAGLRKAARTEGAAAVAGMVKRFASLSPRECVEETRETLETVLLGERDLPIELIGPILDGIGTADEILREAGDSH